MPFAGRASKPRIWPLVELPFAEGNIGYEPLALQAAPAQGRHIGLDARLVDEDEMPGIKSTLILAPLRAPPCDLGVQLFGGKNAFFEAQPPRMDEAPDLHIVDPDPAFGQFDRRGQTGRTATGDQDVVQ